MMNVSYYPNLPQFSASVVTNGFFDGVHLGHRNIIRLLLEQARHWNAPSVLITYQPWPRSVVTNIPTTNNLLTPLNEKIELLATLGIDHLVIVPFDAAFISMTAFEYIEQFLVHLFKPLAIVSGYDHRFGNKGLGNSNLLTEQATRWGYDVKLADKYLIGSSIVSSTKIRQALQTAQLLLANTMLGYCFTLEGEVIEGKKIGRTLGYPTANLKLTSTDKIIPAHGVYIVQCTIQKQHYRGMMNIGIKPTLGELQKTIEVFLLDFNQTLYGSTVQVSMLQFVRPEIKFASLNELRAQLQQDEATARAYFKLLDR